MSLMGVVMMTGISVSDSILIVEFVGTLREGGTADQRGSEDGLQGAFATDSDDHSGDCSGLNPDGARTRTGANNMHLWPGRSSADLVSRLFDGFPGTGSVPAGASRRRQDQRGEGVMQGSKIVVMAGFSAAGEWSGCPGAAFPKFIHAIDREPSRANCNQK